MDGFAVNHDSGHSRPVNCFHGLYFCTVVSGNVLEAMEFLLLQYIQCSWEKLMHHLIASPV